MQTEKMASGVFDPDTLQIEFHAITVNSILERSASLSNPPRRHLFRSLLLWAIRHNSKEIIWDILILSEFQHS